MNPSLESETAAARYVDLDVAALVPHDVYRLLIGSVIPRPIAWLTSLGPNGVNAAPFSCYTFVSTVPPLVAMSCGRKGTESKDSVVNAQREGEFVLNVVSEEFLLPMHRSSAEFPADMSEVTALGIETEASHMIRTPRVRGVPVSMECRTHQVIEFGSFRTQLLVGEVVRFHVRKDCYSDGRIDVKAVKPVGRLGGPSYAALGKFFHMDPVGEYFHPADTHGKS
jgi:flavin reductase (DIM6/NTAB) family NADH-FMN oxidoreductase RutF